MVLQKQSGVDLDTIWEVDRAGQVGFINSTIIDQLLNS